MGTFDPLSMITPENFIGCITGLILMATALIGMVATIANAIEGQDHDSD